MRNIKLSFFYTIIIVNAIQPLAPIGTGFVKAADEVISKHSPAFIKLMESLGDKSILAAKVIGSDAAKVAGSDAAVILGKSAVDASSKIGIESVEKLSKVGTGMVVVAGVAVAIHGTTKLYPIGKEIVSAICPSEDERRLKIENAEAVQKRVDLLLAERAFRWCLIDNRLNPDRGVSGIPVVCEKAAEMYSFLGRLSEVEETTACFNKFRK